MDNVRADVATLMGGSSADITPTPTPDTPSVPTSTCLGKGDSGPEVEQLQKNLIKLGYDCGSWGADGDFGNDTEKAVIKFQRDNGLEVDGLVGPLTQAAIEKALKSNSSTPTPTPSVNEMYRVRKTWADAKSQIGAYRILENAIAACDKAGINYKVFDSKGNQVYPKANNSSSSTTQSTTSTIITPATTYSGVKLGSSSKDERGQYRGGQAGDQTKAEVHIQDWYNGGWNYNSLYTQALKVNLDLSKITTPCECDCSSLVSICCICAGLPASIFYEGGNMRTTYTLLAACNVTGQFTVYSSADYTKAKDKLYRGDILLASGHTVIVLSPSRSQESTTTATISSSTSSYQVVITANILNVRATPSNDSKITTTVKKGWVYTIVEEKEGWGKLKSGAGWIDLRYTKKR